MGVQHDELAGQQDSFNHLPFSWESMQFIYKPLSDLDLGLNWGYHLVMDRSIQCLQEVCHIFFLFKLNECRQVRNVDDLALLVVKHEIHFLDEKSFKRMQIFFAVEMKLAFFKQVIYLKVVLIVVLLL